MANLSPLVQVAIQVVIVVVALVAGTFDILYRRIPNWLVLPAVLIGFGLNAFGGWPGLQRSAIGFALGFGIYFVLYLLHAMGAGDVKLMGALGALTGPNTWFLIFIISNLLGGLVAIFLMVVKGRVRKTLANIGYILFDLLSFRAPHLRSPELDVKSEAAFRLPHGAVIALGCLAVLGGGALLAR